MVNLLFIHRFIDNAHTLHIIYWYKDTMYKLFKVEIHNLDMTDITA